MNNNWTELKDYGLSIPNGLYEIKLNTGHIVKAELFLGNWITDDNLWFLNYGLDTIEVTHFKKYEEPSSMIDLDDIETIILSANTIYEEMFINRSKVPKKYLTKYGTKLNLKQFCADNSGREVHRSWRDRMLEQNREVAENRLQWNTLDEKDKELDKLIAVDVITDFLVFVKSHGYKIEDIDF